jgi:hypothetical protein
MLTSIDSFFSQLARHFKDYNQVVKSNGLMILRVVMYIPCIAFIFAVDLSLMFLDGVKQMILQPLLANIDIYKNNNENNNENTSNTHSIILKILSINYIYKFFEGVIMIVIYGINVAIFAVKGSSNLVFLILSFSNYRLFKKF